MCIESKVCGESSSKSALGNSSTMPSMMSLSQGNYSQNRGYSSSSSGLNYKMQASTASYAPENPISMITQYAKSARSLPTGYKTSITPHEIG